MSIETLGKPDYTGQIYALGQRVTANEGRLSFVTTAQATYNARLTALELGNTGGSSGPVAWLNITGKPTTLGGYGITDAVTTFAGLSGKPTTLSGYGITDAQSATGSVAWSRITATPTTLAGYGIADAQPLDGDLTSLAAASATNALYYRSAANTWAPVTIGANLTFSGGTLAATAGGGGSGTVTSISVTSANGVSGTVANSTTTPAITLALGAITPSSVAATGAVSGSNLSGTNTGDQTSVTGNAGSATKLQTARTINGVAFDGTANITLPTGAAITDVRFPVNFTAAADAYIPAYAAMTIAQGNAPIGTGTVAYAASTSAAPSTFSTVTLPATLQAGAWLKVSVTAVTGFYALDLYRSA